MAQKSLSDHNTYSTFYSPFLLAISINNSKKMTERKFGIFGEDFLVEKDFFSVCKPSPWLLEKRKKN